MEHPEITRMNDHGFLGTSSEEEHLDNCEKCDRELYRGDEVIEFNDKKFCNEDCLIEAISDNPETFGAETTKLS